MRPRFLGAVGLATIGAVLLALLPSAAAQAQGYSQDYGSIAYSPSTGFVIAGFGPSYPDAALAAVQGCGAAGVTDCTTLDWFHDAVGALAKGTNGVAGTGEGWSNNITVAADYASQYAIQTCQQAGGTDCQVTNSFHTPTVSSSGSGGIFFFTLQDPRLQGAIAWEQANQGSPKWDGWCEQSVEAAYGVPRNEVPPGYSSAADDYQAQLAAGRIHTGYNAPAGALVFFNGDSSSGHVGIAVGDGADYWTSDGTIHIAPFSEGLGYLGWSFAPTSPPHNWPGS